MKTESRILVVVDPTVSDEQVCVERGAWLAKSLDVGIELLICHYEQFLTSARAGQRSFVESSRKMVVGENRKKLENIAEPLRDQGLDVIVSSVWDRPLDDSIVRHVLRTNPRFVLKDTHYHSKLRQAIFTNSDWNLILKCPAPVWLSKPHDWPADARIIASIDPAHEHDVDSTLDALILNEAQMLASKLSGELHVFHAHRPLSSHMFSTADSRVVAIEELEKNFDQERKESYDALVTQRDISGRQSHWVEGKPDTLLPELATRLDAGLVVMGAIARNKLESIFVGSTTENVLDKLPCDLLIVKPSWFSTPVVPGTPDYYTGTREKLPTPHHLDDNEYGSFDDVAV